jgi:REP element-mobilizing transposase RayT
MPRKLRIQYPGALYHVMNRGDRHEKIFADDKDRERFVDTLGEACGKTGWQVHAYYLMSNHFHLVVETPQPNLVAGMKWFLGTYTSRFNRRHKEFGHLFSGRYKSLIVDGSGNGYLKSVCDYVHLNPVRAKLLETGQTLEAYAWSSYGQYLKAPAQRARWLRVDRLLGEWGIPKDSPAGRRRFGQVMEHRRSQETARTDWKDIERGWCLGDEEFRTELLAQVREQRGDHYGEELRQADEAHAQGLVREELRQRGWTEQDLAERRKGDSEKLKIAWRLRQETTMGYT